MGNLIDKVKGYPVIPKHLKAEKFPHLKDTFFVDSKFIEYMETLNDNLYQFDRKAVWARLLAIPLQLQENVNNVNESQCDGESRIPNLEHWAFIARASGTVKRKEKEAYIIAHLNKGDTIPTDNAYLNSTHQGNNVSMFAARKREPMKLLFTTDKKAAAMCIQSSIAPQDVWVNKPPPDKENYILKDGELVNHSLIDEEWQQMGTAIPLRELNNKVSKISYSGKTYDALNINCQNFADQLFNLSDQEDIVGPSNFVVRRSWRRMFQTLIDYHLRGNFKGLFRLTVMLVIAILARENGLFDSEF